MVASGLEKSGKFDFFFKVMELSGNFENWSVKIKNPEKSGKSKFERKICYILLKIAFTNFLL